MSFRTVFINDATKLKFQLDSILVEKENNKITIPLSDINIIISDGLNTTVTTRLLSKLNKYNIPIVFCDEKHIPSGVLTAFYGNCRTSKVLKKQISWKYEIKGKCWQYILKYKIYNEANTLYLINKTKFINEIDLLYRYANEIVPHDKTSREGVCAKVYYRKLFGEDFRRDFESLDIINVSLNFGYSILRSYISKCCIGSGLLCSIGIHHKSEYNNLNLCDDLIEPFRSFVDFFVYENYKNHKFLTVQYKSQLINILNSSLSCLVFHNDFFKRNTNIIPRAGKGRAALI